MAGHGPKDFAFDDQHAAGTPLIRRGTVCALPRRGTTSEGGVAFDRMSASSAVAVLRLDGQRQLGDGRRKPVPRVDIHTELVVASAKVLDEAVSRAERSRLRPRIGRSWDFSWP